MLSIDKNDDDVFPSRHNLDMSYRISRWRRSTIWSRLPNGNLIPHKPDWCFFRIEKKLNWEGWSMGTVRGHDAARPLLLSQAGDG